MANATSTLTYWPLHLTHVLVAMIYAIMILGITGIEAYFLAPSLTGIAIFWVVIQNVGIAATSGYYVARISVSPTSGLTETTAKP